MTETTDASNPADRHGPFGSLDDYLDLPHPASLALSPDGRTLVIAVAELDEERTARVSSLWAIDPTGETEARRLTRSAGGDSAPVYASTGDLLFLRKPTGADASTGTGLWVLPAVGGDARRIAHRSGGVGGPVAARNTTRVVLTGDVLGSETDDDRLRTLRKDTKVSAVLHSGYPVRHWDQDLGPGRAHLFSVDADGANRTDLPLVDLTPDPGGVAGGGALRDATYDLAPDGCFVVTSEGHPGPEASTRQVLVRYEVDSGARAVLVDDPDADVFSPAISPDGRSLAFLHESRSTPDTAPCVTLRVMDLETGDSARWAADWDRWPSSTVWSADSRSLLVTADDDGRAPIFVVTESSARSLTTDDAAYTDVVAARDGSAVFALRASYAAPPHPVRVDRETGAITVLRAPTELPELPGDLVDVETVTDAGHRVRAWLARPTGASDATPAPLVVWVHGGPIGSWNTWSWRWNPWILVARGYAVLLPDPALSTGYGQEFLQRGWGRWGTETYDDILAITDAAEARPDVDAARTALMGGSFGGYMANWIAGHTDRFSAIVSHAGLWALDQFGPTTDDASYWLREMTPEMAFDNSPHLSVADIVTPMLIIHGDKDYRVPIGEALRLWFELLSESGLPADENGVTDHRFLVFPTENHWILSPQHAKVWYEVVDAFLARHVLGIESEMPEVLPS